MQIFRQEHFTKIVVGLLGFVDDGSDFQELLILEYIYIYVYIYIYIFGIKVFFIRGATRK